MHIHTILLLIGASLLGGCSLLRDRQPEPTPAPLADVEANASSASANNFDEFGHRNANGNFSKSSFVVQDFMNVVGRVPDFTPGTTRFSSALPRTQYGEILLEALRQEGFAIVLGNTVNAPELRYSIELPSENTPDVHTFFLSLGEVQLKRSYEIFGERIAPVSDMLMSGINPASLRPYQAKDPARTTRSISASTSEPTQPKEPLSISAQTAQTAQVAPIAKIAEISPKDSSVGVQRINALVSTDEDWDPLDVNLYETGESVYQPMFADSSQNYKSIAHQVLVFPNDSLVLGAANKQYLFELAQQVKQTDDVIRLIGCSHGKSSLSDGNEKLAKGRAIRVREELMLAGVDEPAILHEACWANVHFDEQLPRRGVVVQHLRPRG